MIKSLVYKQRTVFLISAFLLLWQPWLAADNSKASVPDQPVDATSGTPENTTDDEIKIIEKYGKTADGLHVALTNRISSSADWIDSFFRDERVEIEENQTSLRIRISAFLQEGEDVDFRVRARFRFVLPHLEDKVHLFISSVVEDDDPFEDTYAEDFDNDNNEERNLNLSLRYFFKAAKKRNISFRVGAGFSSFKPRLYGGPRFSFSKKLDSWNLRFIESVTYFTDSGWESKTSLDCEKPFSDSFFFRAGFDGKWYEDEYGYLYAFNNSLYQSLSDHQGLLYQVNAGFETHPCNALSEVVVQVKYRTRFWREWMFFEIAPQLSFSRDEDFDTVPGVFLAIEGLFGKGVFK